MPKENLENLKISSDLCQTLTDPVPWLMCFIVDTTHVKVDNSSFTVIRTLINVLLSSNQMTLLIYPTSIHLHNWLQITFVWGSPPCFPVLTEIHLHFATHLPLSHPHNPKLTVRKEKRTNCLQEPSGALPPTSFLIKGHLDLSARELSFVLSHFLHFSFY